MKKKRAYPFGYCMKNGKIQPEAAESELVIRIFNRYLEGESLQSLAKAASMSGLPYRENTEGWNKAMIARVLDCKKYAGYDGFPQLVPASLFQQAQKLRTEKSQAYGGSLNPALKEIRSQICCHACGQTMHRRNLGSQDAILWQCPECRKEICLPDRELLDGLITAANRAISRPEQVNAFQKDRGLLSITAMRLENEIRRELGNPKADTNRLLQIIQECAQEKYRVCSAENAWRTKEIFQMLSAMKPITSFQPQQWKRIIWKILIAPPKTITIQLYNQVVI